MQTKVVIGTVAFMLAMIIMGFATLLEPARLERTTAAFEARQIENGAALFRDNCTECHGVAGRAESCFNVSGDQIGCAGLPLNSTALLCGERSERMVQLAWGGSKSNLIVQSISSGRLGTLMPVWSQEFGGPMEAHQIDQISSYILNWSKDPALCGDGKVVIEAVDWPASVADLPAGDPANGANIYLRCFGCHGDPGSPGTNAVGPWLGNIGNAAGDRVPGLSGADYIYQSVLDPEAFIAPICVGDNPCSEASAMQAMNFGSSLGLQDMADIVTYLEGLTR